MQEAKLPSTHWSPSQSQYTAPFIWHKIFSSGQGGTGREGWREREEEIDQPPAILSVWQGRHGCSVYSEACVAGGTIAFAIKVMCVLV